MKIISWNVNGIRACAKKGMIDFIMKENADIFAIQEVKANLSQLSDSIIKLPGYNFKLFSAQKLGYSGVGIYVKDNMKCDFREGLKIKEFDLEGRTLELWTDNFVFINAYFPNSQPEGKRLDYKVSFCEEMLSRMNKIRKNKNILLSGDYNIAHTPIDLTHPEDNERSPGYFPEERAFMDKFLKSGYIDTFRMFTKEGEHYTWWSYRTNARERNVGWRIDYHSVNSEMKDKIIKSYHNTNILGSDHCPVTINIRGVNK